MENELSNYVPIYLFNLVMFYAKLSNNNITVYKVKPPSCKLAHNPTIIISPQTQQPNVSPQLSYLNPMKSH